MVMIVYSTNPNSESVQIQDLPGTVISTIAAYMGNNDMIMKNAVMHNGNRLRIIYRVSLGMFHKEKWIFRYWKSLGTRLHVSLGPILQR